MGSESGAFDANEASKLPGVREDFAPFAAFCRGQAANIPPVWERSRLSFAQTRGRHLKRAKSCRSTLDDGVHGGRGNDSASIRAEDGTGPHCAPCSGARAVGDVDAANWPSDGRVYCKAE